MATVQSKLFYNITEASADADRRIVGRSNFLGIELMPKYAPGVSGVLAIGTIQLKDSTDDNGTVLFEIPTVACNKYIATTNISFEEDSGYIEFSNGMYIDSTAETGGILIDPMSAFSIILYYGGLS